MGKDALGQAEDLLLEALKAGRPTVELREVVRALAQAKLFSSIGGTLLYLQGIVAEVVRRG